MTKYQLDHFKEKVRRNFDPLIEEQELLVKQYRAEATEKIVGKLAKKMGADKILAEFEKAEQDKEKKSLNYNMRERDEKITLKDCKEQLTDWARDLVDKEIRRRPEGLKLKQLEELKRHSIDTVMESGTPDDLLKALDATTKKIGIAWVVDTSKIKQIASQ